MTERHDDDAATIRVMRPDEYDAVRAMVVSSFDDDGIGVLLDALHSSWAWRDELSFVAELDGRIVGHVLYTIAILDAPERLVDVLLLSPLAVHPDAAGAGVGHQLVSSTLALLRQRDEAGVFLEGDPGYYGRFGFVAAGDLGFRKPSLRIPDDAFQVYKLSDELDALSGTLVYQDAFWRTDSVGLR